MDKLHRRTGDMQKVIGGQATCDKRHAGRTGDMRQAIGGQGRRHATFRQAFLPITYPLGEENVWQSFSGGTKIA